MAEELSARLKNFSLSASELEGVSLLASDVAVGMEEGGRSLFGKIHGQKKANFFGLKKTFLSLWHTEKQFILRELDFNLFQFVFASVEDKNTVLKGKLWYFENQLLVLKEWEENWNFKEGKFNLVNIWIQFWNIPNHWISPETGLRIKKVLDVVVPETGSPKGRFIKVFATIDLENPLLRGTFIKLGDSSSWVDFKYENLINICYYCGIVGHLDRSCGSRKSDISNNVIKEGQFGEWIFAEDLSFPPKIVREPTHLSFSAPSSQPPPKSKPTSPNSVNVKQNPHPSLTQVPPPPNRDQIISLRVPHSPESSSIPPTTLSNPPSPQLPQSCSSMDIDELKKEQESSQLTTHSTLVNIPLSEKNSRTPLSIISLNASPHSNQETLTIQKPKKNTFRKYKNQHPSNKENQPCTALITMPSLTGNKHSLSPDASTADLEDCNTPCKKIKICDSSLLENMVVVASPNWPQSDL